MKCTKAAAVALLFVLCATMVRAIPPQPASPSTPMVLKNGVQAVITNGCLLLPTARGRYSEARPGRYLTSDDKAIVVEGQGRLSAETVTLLKSVLVRRFDRSKTADIHRSLTYVGGLKLSPSPAPNALGTYHQTGSHL